MSRDLEILKTRVMTKQQLAFHDMELQKQTSFTSFSMSNICV